MDRVLRSASPVATSTRIATHVANQHLKTKSGSGACPKAALAPVNGPVFSDGQTFRCSIIEILYLKIFQNNMLVRCRGINNNGVLERPWTIWKVLNAISSTSNLQFTGKCWKIDFVIPFKTKSCQSSREDLRTSMLRALSLDTPRSPQFEPEV